MKYAKLENAARELSEEERRALLKQLVEDVRFPAVVRILLDQRDLAQNSSCAISFADHHGCLAHAAGVTYCVNEVLGRVKEICEPPKRRGAQPPAERQHRAE